MEEDLQRSIIVKFIGASGLGKGKRGLVYEIFSNGQFSINRAPTQLYFFFVAGGRGAGGRNLAVILSNRK